MPFFLTPEHRQTTFWVLAWLAFALLLYALGPILTPFIAAAILAYALNGAVDYLDHHRFGRFTLARSLAVLLVMTLFLCSMAALILIVIPVLQQQIPLLKEQIPLFLARLNSVIAPRLLEMGISVQLDVAGIRALLTEHIAASGDEIWATIVDSARIGGTAVLGWIVTLTLVPVVMYYMLLDWHQNLARIAGAVPRRYLAQSVAMANEVDSLLAQYLRGQLLVMLVLALFYSLALTMVGLNVALPVGVITGLLVFIPYIGFGLGMALALIAALLQFPDWFGLLSVAAIYGVGQVVESFYLTPRLVGERIGLNPLAVIFALLAFGQLFGFVGVLVALPASAVLMVAFGHLRHHYLRSTFYNG